MQQERPLQLESLLELVFEEVGIELEFSGAGVNEKATVVKCTNPLFQIEIGKEVLSIDSNYFRPSEVDLLIGDPSKAKNKLGWIPEYDLESLVKEMIQSDLKLMQKDQYLKEGGYNINNH